MEPTSSKTVFIMDSDSAYNSVVLDNGTLNLKDLYKSSEKELFLMYKTVAIIIGFLVVLCNLTVVVSSGLILRKGQQPKNTYLLLGNVSLADTMVGFFLIISAINQSFASSPICVFKTGMLVCPAIVSIFTVALIAVDRYCYILHGLYYHRYFTTTRVRISIAITWICGITLGFSPVVGLVKQNIDDDSTCSYFSLFPDYLILINTILSIIMLMLIAVMYSIILINALKNVKKIKASRITIKPNKDSKSGDNLASVTIHKGNNTKLSEVSKQKCAELKKSASFSSSRDYQYVIWANLNTKSKSISDLTDDEPRNERRNSEHKAVTQRGSTTTSEYSITSIDLSSSFDPNASSVNISSKKRIQNVCKTVKDNIKRKKNEPSKLRAVIVVTLTSGSIIITWLPFFITVILFILCENKQYSYQCLRYKLLLGPFLTLAFLNSLLNPLIYAWWHKGFKKGIKNYYRRHICNKTNRSNCNNSTTYI